MPRIADFIVIADGPITLPDQSGIGINDIHIQVSDPPNVDTTLRSILVFQVDPHPIPIRLGVALNDINVLDHTFRTDPVRSWHLAIPANVLRPHQNELSMAALNIPEAEGNQGVIRISNVVLFFHANIP